MIGEKRRLILGVLGAVCLSGGPWAYADDPLLRFDLATEMPAAGVLSRHHGDQGEGRFGVPVAGGFDCDGDGHKDTGFSQMRASPLGRTRAGQAILVFGTGAIGGVVDTAGFDPGYLKIAGDQPFETAGDEIWMGDVTGDGIGDLLIGRQNVSSASWRKGNGALTLVVGGAGLKTHAATLDYLDLREPPAGVTVVTFIGAAAWDRLGIWFRTGDITGDGIDDIVVGADEVDAVGESNRGAVYVIRGGPHLAAGGTRVIRLSFFGDTELAGHLARIDPPAGSAGYHFGATCNVCDLDGNGRTEVLAAATLLRSGASIRLPSAPFGTGQSTGGAPDGSLFICWDENFPAGLWPAGYAFSIDDPPVGDFSRIDGKTGNNHFGEEILGGLDYSGDGLADLFIGDLAGNNPLPNGNFSGIGNVFYTASKLRGRTFSMNSPPADLAFSTVIGPRQGAIGADTAAHGDFDNDGIADLAVGNPHDVPQSRHSAGTVHIFYGQAGGWPGTIDLKASSTVGDGLPGPDQMRIAQIDGGKGTTGSNRGDTLCYSAAAADLDGDSRTDFIVNEMVGDGPGGTPEDVGNCLIISGAALLDPPVARFNFSTGALHDFGSVTVGGGGALQSVVVTNSSGATITIDSVAIEGPESAGFTIETDSGEATLMAGESRTLGVRFDPAATGDSGAAVIVRTAANPRGDRAGLKGTGQ